MAAAEEPKPSDTVQALVQLLRTRSAEEIRERMYDNPPGSPWWSACKTELDVRNGEKMAAALVDTSRILDKLKSAAEQLDGLTDKLVQTTNDMAAIGKAVKESGRRMELTTYVIVAITIVQLFYIEFQFSATPSPPKSQRCKCAGFCLNRLADTGGQSISGKIR